MYRTAIIIPVLALCCLPLHAEVTRAGVRVYREDCTPPFPTQLQRPLLGQTGEKSLHSALKTPPPAPAAAPSTPVVTRKSAPQPTTPTPAATAPPAKPVVVRTPATPPVVSSAPAPSPAPKKAAPLPAPAPAPAKVASSPASAAPATPKPTPAVQTAPAAPQQAPTAPAPTRRRRLPIAPMMN